MANSASQTVSIGEINPGLNNPDAKAGGNNAIYTYVYVKGKRIPFQAAIWSYWDPSQNPLPKYKYGVGIITDGDMSGLPVGAKILGTISSNLYWQIQEGTVDLCTVGESLAEASTGAIVLVQTVNPNLPSQ